MEPTKAQLELWARIGLDPLDAVGWTYEEMKRYFDDLQRFHPEPLFPAVGEVLEEEFVGR